MPDRNALDLEVLRPAIEAARKALRRLDEEDVPARLQAVASSSAKRLPPPMAQRLVEALSSDPWLRSKALEEWSGDEQSAARRFLEARDGWEAGVSQAVVESAASRLVAERDRARAQVAALEESLERSKAREREIERSLQQVEGSVEQARKDERARVRVRLEEARTAAHVSEERARKLEGRVEELDSELDELRTRNAALEDRIRSRSTRSRAEERAATTRGRGAPLEVARLLDETAAALVRAVHVDAPGGSEVAVFALPPGVRPDQPAAVDALISWPGSVMVIVDGYNLAKTLHENAALPKARLRVEELLRRLRNTATGSMRMIVVWDSVEGDDDRTEAGLDIRFRPSADDEIAALAGSMGGSVVVITADRELRSRAEHAGATGLWSGALTGWKP